nr:unnamed protein product [Callosobruchus analis]
MDIHIFQYILKQKDQLIIELKDKIKLLNDHINLLINQGNSNGKVNDAKNAEDQKTSPHSTILKQSNQAMTRKTNADTCVEKSKQNPQTNIESQKNTFVDKSAVAAAVVNAEHQAAMNRIINLNVDGEQIAVPSDSQGWKKVNNRRRRNAIFGSNSSTLVKAVPRLAQLHVSRIDPSTSVADLQKLLSEHFPEVKCEVFTPKHPSVYSSFKVSIHESNFKKAMSPDIWPFGASVRRFFVRHQIHNKNV